MEKRSWTNIKVLEPQIIGMREAGKTRQEIADALGLTKEQIKKWVWRYNRRGERPGRRRRSKKTDSTKTNQALRREIESLRMENDLLRTFMELVERGRGQA